MPNPLTIAGEYFPSQTAAETRCQEILYAQGIKFPIKDAKQIAFLKVLFFSRPEKVAELNGREIDHWGRLRVEYNTPCFAAFLKDGNAIDFSFTKSVRAVAQKCGDERS